MATDRHGKRLLIGEVAERTGLTERTLRYYEEQGLISPTDVSPGGFRLYSLRDLHRLEVIQGFKDLGFSLAEVREALNPEASGTRDGKEAQISFSTDVLKSLLDSLDEHLSRLQEQRDHIVRALELLGQCQECRRESCPNTCPNLEAFL